MSTGKTIGLLAGLALLFLIVGTVSAISDHSNYKGESMTFEYKEDVVLEGQTIIDVYLSSDNVDVYRASGDELEVYYVRTCSSNEEYQDLEEKFTVKKDENMVEIFLDDFNTHWWNDNFLSRLIAGNFTFTSRLELGIPESFGEDVVIRVSSGNIASSDLNQKRIDFQASSGRITIDDATAETINASTSSGNIEVTGSVATNELNLQASSGRITMNDVRTNLLDASTSSGNIVGEDVVAVTSNVRASSGRIELSGEMGETDASTTSGNIILVFDAASSDIEASASSGGIKVTLPRDAEFEVESDYSSGNFRTDFTFDSSDQDDDHFYGRTEDGRDGFSVSMSTTSGNQNLYEGN